MCYISVVEAAAKWGISLRRVQQLLAGSRIPGAKKYGRSWMLPADAVKPADPRREKSRPKNALSADLASVIAATTLPMPIREPDAVLNIVREERLRIHYEAELAYLRGDFEKTIRCFNGTEGDDASRLRVCPVAVAAAISAGDYRVYTEIDAFLKRCIQSHKGSGIAAMAELSLATAAVSVIAPDMTPEWLRSGDFSALSPEARPNALYLRAKYLNCIGNYEAMLAVAQTALALSAQGGGITTTDIYLRVTCAVACHALGRGKEAAQWLLEAMDVTLPHGFVTPFAELVSALGGLVEKSLEQAYPEWHDAVLGQWERTWKNWITFHNKFTKDNITLILTLREYHIALLVARRVPYAEIAGLQHVSVGRIKNIMLEVYEKLCISGRHELSKFVLATKK